MTKLVYNNISMIHMLAQALSDGRLLALVGRISSYV
jgi:hypothetical protein